ncbi:unnamed protein product [Soboliphyme baturini]|uniref:Peptidase S1 domain-containing protein n=1 Tax=Soboliphyme baturini TaxID=241478 RepID=A0A3P8AGA0_9BILA|nr:unnamed protein product [Soboliphyme baturini]
MACSFKAEDIAVRVGQSRNTSLGPYDQFRFVSHILIHPLFRPTEKARSHNIALLRLQKKVTYSRYVMPAVLPNKTTRSYGQMNVIAFGVLKTKRFHNDYVDQMDVMTLSAEKCAHTPIVMEEMSIQDDEICVIASSSNPNYHLCEIEQGAALVTYRDYHWIVRGVASYPNRCRNPTRPGVYTSTANHIDWIQYISSMRPYLELCLTSDGVTE